MDLPNLENHVALGDPEDEFHVHERDPDDAMERQRDEDNRNRIADDQALCVELAAAIRKLSLSGVFDQRDLIDLLKRAHRRVQKEVPIGIRRQAD